jgi:hypothetical protein
MELTINTPPLSLTAWSGDRKDVMRRCEKWALILFWKNALLVSVAQAVLGHLDAASYLGVVEARKNAVLKL